MVFCGGTVTLSPDDAGSGSSAILVALDAGTANIGIVPGYFDLAVCDGIIKIRDVGVTTADRGDRLAVCA